VQEEPLPLVGALQPVQRHVVGVLADDQVRQQARPWQSLGDRHCRLRRGDHHLAGVRDQEWLRPWLRLLARVSGQRAK